MGRSDEQDVMPNLDVLVRAEKLQLLYHQFSPAILISIINALVLSAVLWSAQDHKLLLAWFAILCITAVGRFFLFVRYNKVAPQGEDVLNWERPYFITLILSSLIWGVGGVLIMPANSVAHQAVVYFYLMGMSGGAVSVYSGHRQMALITVATVLLPATVWSLLQGNIVLAGMASGAIVFFFSAIRATRVLSSTLQRNFTLTNELTRSKEEAERLAYSDELTGLYNRRAFYEHGNMLANYSQRNKEEFSMILMDIDHFKNINDSLGHAAGDAALEQIGKILSQRLRKSDVFARIGGEEFGMLLSASTPENAAQLAEKLRQVIAETPIMYNEESFTLTASFGVAGGEPDIDTLVKYADVAMYQAKEAGRNQVVCDKYDIDSEVISNSTG